MLPSELRATASLAAVFAVRLLGLFMIYPVFAAYARHLQGATPLKIGLALGAYGLAQGLLQMPFGMLSDRIGRKAIIVIGLVLFGIGSLIAAYASSVEGVLIGRVIQGGGAVGSVVLALVADLTREEVRTKAMALVGMTIGFSFMIAIVVGPALAGAIGVPGIFLLTGALAIAGIAITLFLVPSPPRIQRHRDTEPVPALFARVIRDRELLRLDFAIFALHAILTASFLAVPRVLAGTLDLSPSGAWKVYLPVLLASAVLMVPAIIVAEKGRMKPMFLATIVVLGLSVLGLAFAGGRSALAVAALVLFFTAINVMEATLPSLITKLAPAGAKGTATGIYSSSQFIGIFVGGAGGGWSLAAGGTTGVFIFALAVTVVWLVLAISMRRPGHYSSHLVRLERAFERGETGALAARLRAVPGVVDAEIAADEGVAYLKIDRAQFDADAVARIVGMQPAAE